MDYELPPTGLCRGKERGDPLSQFDHIGNHRHRREQALNSVKGGAGSVFRGPSAVDVDPEGHQRDYICLLYTSDAADD